MTNSVIDRAYSLLEGGGEELAIADLRARAHEFSSDPAYWQALGICLRATERLGEAVDSFEQARKFAPTDKKIAQGLAQCRMEAGRAAVAAFREAFTLDGTDLQIIQGLIAAVAAEEGPEPALQQLEPVLARNPDWLAGHWLASRLAAAAGRDEPADRTIAAEVRRRPAAAHLWHHWLFTLFQSRRWVEARRVAEEARRRFPGERILAWNEAAAASEAGDLAYAEQLYRELGPLPDVAQAIYRCRTWLRQSRPDLVSALHGQLSGPAGAEGLFPYFATAWRMMGDPRANSLEPPLLVGAFDLTPRLPPLADLAEHLRTLHNQVRQPLEQSVRLGTQTDGHLLLREEPIIARTREAIREAVAQHIASLPVVDAAHPQLRHRRDRPIRLAGSWSVRLQAGGHHDNHVHPEGWFSSALYVALPESLGGEAKAGWLRLGAPQASLGLDVPPMLEIEPKPGRLVLFPSTMWHGTVPFPAGERLTVAFDVKMPPA